MWRNGESRTLGIEGTWASAPLGGDDCVRGGVAVVVVMIMVAVTCDLPLTKGKKDI